MLKNTLEGLATDPLYFNSHQGLIMFYCFEEGKFKKYGSFKDLYDEQKELSKEEQKISFYRR